MSFVENVVFFSPPPPARWKELSARLEVFNSSINTKEEWSFQPCHSFVRETSTVLISAKSTK